VTDVESTPISSRLKLTSVLVALAWWTSTAMTFVPAMSPVEGIDVS
jgi:hypothetical protein